MKTIEISGSGRMVATIEEIELVVRMAEAICEVHRAPDYTTEQAFRDLRNSDPMFHEGLCRAAKAMAEYFIEAMVEAQHERLQ